MIQPTPTSFVEGSAALQSHSFKISQEAQVHIASLLRNMYTEPLRAVIRELAANAYDAHLAAGVDKPIEFKAPTALDPTMSVRDFGFGLDLDATEALFTYGMSDKRATNDQIGGFGIGCKSPFAIADQFTYTIWHGGIKRIWVMALDSTGMGDARLFHQEESDEPTGVLVEIPIKSSDIYTAQRAAEEVFQYWTRYTPYQYETKAAQFQTKRQKAIWSRTLTLFDSDNRPIQANAWIVDEDSTQWGSRGWVQVLMGTIPYAVKAEDLWDDNHPDTAELARMGVTQKSLGLTPQIYIEMPIGTLPVAPSRETIQLTTKARGVLLGCFRQIAKSVTQQTQDAIGDEPVYLKAWHQVDAADKLLAFTKGSLQALVHNPTGMAIAELSSVYGPDVKFRTPLGRYPGLAGFQMKTLTRETSRFGPHTRVRALGQRLPKENHNPLARVSSSSVDFFPDGRGQFSGMGTSRMQKVAPILWAATELDLNDPENYNQIIKKLNLATLVSRAYARKLEFYGDETAIKSEVVDGWNKVKGWCDYMYHPKAFPDLTTALARDVYYIFVVQVTPGCPHRTPVNRVDHPALKFLFPANQRTQVTLLEDLPESIVGAELRPVVRASKGRRTSQGGRPVPINTVEIMGVRVANRVNYTGDVLIYRPGAQRPSGSHTEWQTIPQEALEQLRNTSESSVTQIPYLMFESATDTTSGLTLSGLGYDRPFADSHAQAEVENPTHLHELGEYYAAQGIPLLAARRHKALGHFKLRADPKRFLVLDQFVARRFIASAKQERLTRSIPALLQGLPYTHRFSIHAVAPWKRHQNQYDTPIQWEAYTHPLNLAESSTPTTVSHRMLSWVWYRVYTQLPPSSPFRRFLRDYVDKLLVPAVSLKGGWPVLKTADGSVVRTSEGTPLPAFDAQEAAYLTAPNRVEIAEKAVAGWDVLKEITEVCLRQNQMDKWVRTHYQMLNTSPQYHGNYDYGSVLFSLDTQLWKGIRSLRESADQAQKPLVGSHDRILDASIGKHVDLAAKMIRLIELHTEGGVPHFEFPDA